MSNHKTPLTELERNGLEMHGMKHCIGKPSQLADVFRAGVAWALANTPPAAQRQWVGLTTEEIQAIAFTAVSENWDWLRFARAIEAKLREKNT